jgi:hypothetical protein
MPFVPDSQQPAAPSISTGRAPPTLRNAPPPAAASTGRFVPDPPAAQTAQPQGMTAAGVAKDVAMAPVGVGEIIMQGVSGAIAAPIAGLGGLAAEATNLFVDNPIDSAGVVEGIKNQLTYQPQSDAANNFTGTIARGADWAAQNVANPALRKVGEVSPTAENVVRTAVPAVAEAVGSVLPVAKAIPAARGMAGGAFKPAPGYNGPGAPRTPVTPGNTAEDVLARMNASNPQNMGAAASTVNLQSATPELRQAVVDTARRTGGAVNPEVLSRHVDADAVFKGRARLSDGQATGDVRLISEEQNMRGRVNGVAEQFDAQNRALGEFMRDLREEVGPEVFSANVVEHGDTLINAYRATDAAAEAQVTAAYTALRQAAGGNFPIGAKALLDDASKRLHDQLIFDHAPKSVMNALTKFADTPGSMKFENFEALRTNLATIQRTATDGLERRAAGIIRQAMEELPLASGAARLKPLADNARRLARERFAAIEADPAYKAAIEESVPPDRFVQKFVVGGTRDDLARMRATIGADEATAQTMGVAALDYLRDQARLSTGYEGNFATNSYTKALQKLSPSLRSLRPADAVEKLEQLGRVANYTTAQPRGSFVNNSNTFTAAAAEGAKGAVEGAANVAAAGIPVGTWIRKGMEGATQRKRARDMFAPGAGLGRLREREPRNP